MKKWGITAILMTLLLTGCNTTSASTPPQQAVRQDTSRENQPIGTLSNGDQFYYQDLGFKLFWIRNLVQDPFGQFTGNLLNFTKKTYYIKSVVFEDFTPGGAQGATFTIMDTLPIDAELMPKENIPIKVEAKNALPKGDSLRIVINYEDR
ncbi:hypothetical protein LLE49_09745 [Alicyclobacillus tolerans]|uniref:hypothetical protein n=1 Tax=Alicyclobacillus tolerans TaxID=90970 RepID=UPI001F4466AE|nr:hypothetical protein [Alicyclobacillus tolerans]MCF8564998.1 hypothetical protein [Alicyclobacillus tolerans]